MTNQLISTTLWLLLYDFQKAKGLTVILIQNAKYSNSMCFFKVCAGYNLRLCKQRWLPNYAWHQKTQLDFVLSGHYVYILHELPIC